MTQEVSAAVNNVVYLASCMVNGTVPDADRVRAMDLQLLYTIADMHLLTGIVGYAREACGVVDSAFAQAKAKAIRKIALFDIERSAVLAELEKAGISHMPLKGCVMKEIYPKIGMRQMADNDILIDCDRCDEVRQIMESLGFETVNYVNDRYNHDSYHKDPVCNFEMHRSLFGPSHDDALFSYYQNIWDKVVRDEGYRSGFHLSEEDFYLYMIAHEFKHYSGGGTGLRSLLDTYVYLKRYELDMDYVGREADKLWIRDFELTNRLLALKLFENVDLSENFQLTVEEQTMLDFILSSGTYGSLVNDVRNQISRKGRWGYLLSRLTLPYDVMKSRYPVLEKVPLLYPFCWMHRLVHGFICNHKVVMCQLREALFSKRK